MSISQVLLVHFHSYDLEEKFQEPPAELRVEQRVDEGVYGRVYWRQQVDKRDVNKLECELIAHAPFEELHRCPECDEEDNEER